MKPVQIYFNPQELGAIVLALSGFLEDLHAMKKPPYCDVPFNPDARKYQKEMIAAGTSAAAKIEKHTGIKCELPPYKEGDADEFLTKES